MGPTGSFPEILRFEGDLDIMNKGFAAMTAIKRLSFKEMCSRFDVTPRTLRYYEYIELIEPEKEGRSRFYTAREIARMKLILRGRRFGFSLEEIRQWLQMRESEGAPTQMKAWIDHADRQLALLREQHDELTRTINDLQKLRDDTANGDDD
jgi:DNA-binding transcriptional MerR regulator